MDPEALARAKASFRLSFAPAAPTHHNGAGSFVMPTAPPPVARARMDIRAEMLQESGLGGAADHAEVQRITSLPVVYPMTPEEVEVYSRMNTLAEAWNAGFRLFPIQADTVATYESCGGAIGRVGVGFGKTLISLMCADKAYRKGIERSFLIIPPEVFIQLYTVDIIWARNRVPLSMPIHWLPTRDLAGRKALAASKKRGLYVYTHSLLSSRDAEHNLREIDPGLIIIDECQRVKDKSAARTRRLTRYLHDRMLRKMPCEVVALSGTITTKSIKDYRHLCVAALGLKAPMPLGEIMANEWAAILDAPASSGWEDDKQPAGTGGSGPLLPLVHWAMRTFPREPIGENVHGFRRAFRLRLDHSAGVTSSGDAAIGTTLIMTNRPVEHPEHFTGWPMLQKLIKQVCDEWKTPNGDEIEHQINTWKWLYELSAGFYNQLTWPSNELMATRARISQDQAAEIMGKTLLHHAAGQAYRKELRRWLGEKHIPGVDTPMLVGSDMARNGAKNVGTGLYDYWRYWKSLDFEHRPERDRTAVRVCDFKIHAAVKWACEIPHGTGAIIWVFNEEMGKWVYEALVASGVQAMHCPAGEHANAAILDHGNKHLKVVASLTAHGTGKNLQHFQHQYFVQWPRAAGHAEQCLGRTHRSGQEAEELVVYTCNTGEFDEINFAACLNDALYIHQTSTRQKLIYAVYNPLPRIFPSAVLFERGLQNTLLSVEQEREMREKFQGEAA